MIKAYDEVGNFGYDEDTADIVLESFINAFQAPFWSLIPDSGNPAKDLLQKQERMGVSVSESQIEPPTDELVELFCYQGSFFTPARMTVNQYLLISSALISFGDSHCVCQTRCRNGFLCV